MEYMNLIFAFVFSLSLVLAWMPFVIKYLKKINYNQAVSEYSLQEYKEKKSTPTMGGVLFVLVPVIVTLVLLDKNLELFNLYMVMFAFVAYGLIGFLDDYIIVIKKDNEGLKPRHKLILQILVSVVFYVIYSAYKPTLLYIPFINVYWNIGIFYAFFIFFMFTAESNAVNITDGMDGLAGGLSFIALIPFAIISLVKGQYNLLVFICACLGALLGFLRFNITPAKIFMGDTGSLALGGLFAAVAMVLHQEIALIFIGGVFVYEIACVVIQLTSVKLRKKRVFKYTPIHYSFVLDGLKEKTVVRSFWLLGVICAVVGLFVGLA